MNSKDEIEQLFGRRCAVVSGSRELLQSKKGTEIDNHDSG
jgi:hypothetical protein